MAAADVYCQPNTGPEPFGIAFVEALLAGLPVVTSALGGALEIIDETCGIVVPPGDPVALSSELRDLIDDTELQGRLSAAGPARGRELCDSTRQVAALHEVLMVAATTSIS
jgi:glycosyltransferase involved in cell wall biosynthesis